MKCACRTKRTNADMHARNDLLFSGLRLTSHRDDIEQLSLYCVASALLHSATSAQSEEGLKA
jgi:hypothetical protein